MNADNPRAVAGSNSGNLVGDQITSIIERVERLLEDKAAVTEDIKEVFAEAKGNGLDPRVLRALIAERKADKDALAEFQELMDLYRSAMERGSN